MNKLAVAIIAGDSWRESEVKAMLASLEGVADGIFVAYNGSKSKLKWSKWTNIPLTYKKFEWEDDFAKARQQSFDLVPKDKFDWIMWLDTDDVFVYDKVSVNSTPLQDMFESLDEYTQGIYLRYDYAIDPNTGEVMVQQWRERILSTKARIIWKYPIHEVATLPPGSQYARRDHAHVEHQRTAEDTRGTSARNRRIIAKALREHPDNARMQFYFASETMAEADGLAPGPERNQVADAAILAYRRFLQNEQGQIDDQYMAANRIGQLYLMKQEWNSAIDSFLQAIKLRPDWPDSYIGIAQACMELEDWGRQKSFANLALSLPKPDTSATVTPLTYEYTPHLLRGIAEEELKNYDEAIKDYEKAISIWHPPNSKVEERIKGIKDKLAVTTKDTDERKRLRGSRPERSIAFVTAPLPEPWHPALERENGAGGAETCIMRLAPRFAADGYRVAVFGTPGEHYGVDENGVEWWNSQDFLANEKFQVVVASRVPEIFEADINADKKLLWMHDVNVGPRLYPFRERPDAIIGLTNWHVNHMSRLYDIPLDRFAQIPNGIELDLYDLANRVEGNGELRFIWSSSADRGLGTLVSMWPQIKSAFPNSVLDIFYGWNIIDKIIEQGGARSGYLRKMKNDILGNIAMLGGEAAGIYQHGRVAQSELAKHQLRSHVWAYPTDFMETFCITALEMQAAGVIPVTSELAALKETVALPGLRIKGWPLNHDYQSRYLDKLFSVIESPPEQIEEYRMVGRHLAEAHSWDNSYAKWTEVLGGL